MNDPRRARRLMALSDADLARRLAGAVAARNYDALPALRMERARRAMAKPGGGGTPYTVAIPRPARED